MRCVKCKSEIDESKVNSFIKCDGCNKFFHIPCSELTAPEVKCLESRPASKRRMKYICLDCEQGVHQVPKLIAMVHDLQVEIEKLKSLNTTALESASSSTCNDSSLWTVEKIVQEISERSKRECNLIIYNVQEPEGLSKQDQTTSDMILVNDMLTQLNITQPASHPLRLGKFIASATYRSRPLRVRLNSVNDVVTVLKKFKNLQGLDKWNNIRVSRDRTPMQINLYKSVKEELGRRLSLGENNLKIIYRNGIPTIITQEN